jgi:hypothetical protein
MHLRKMPWRYFLPGVIFPMSIATWVQYYLSARASDDAPAPWYWYGGPLSAWLNFPAYVYSTPAQPLVRFGIRLGGLWLEPRVVTFFLLVFMFWYWVGTHAESWGAAKIPPQVGEKPSRVRRALYSFGAIVWIWVTIGTVLRVASMVHRLSWYGLRYVYRDAELLVLAQLFWSAILAVYYSRKFVQGLQARMAA